MWEMEKIEFPVARKNYHCEASEWIGNTLGFDEREYTPEEWAHIEQAKEKGFKILKGEKYVKVSGKWEGEYYLITKASYPNKHVGRTYRSQMMVSPQGMENLRRFNDKHD